MLSMMLATLIAASAPTERVLVMDVEAGTGVSAEDARLLTGAVAEAVAGVGHPVATGEDLRALSSLAADQQACGVDATDCLSELAGAIDAQRIVHARLTRVGSQLLVQLVAFDARAAASEGRRSWRGDDLGAVLGRVDGEVRALLGVETPPDWVGYGLLGASGAVAAGAVAAGAMANSVLLDPATLRADKDAAYVWGWVSVGVGLTAAAGLGAVGAARLVSE